MRRFRSQLSLKQRKLLTEEEWKQISGSNLAGKMVSNNLEVISYYHVNKDELEDWVEENMNGVVYIHWKENYQGYGHGSWKVDEPKVIYFELKKDAATFLMFWDRE